MLADVEEENNQDELKTNMDKMKELVSSNKKSTRAIFSDDIAKKVLNHESKYKVEE